MFFGGRVKVISTVGNQSTLCHSSPYPSPCTEYASLLEVYPTVDCLQLGLGLTLIGRRVTLKKKVQGIVVGPWTISLTAGRSKLHKFSCTLSYNFIFHFTHIRLQPGRLTHWDDRA